MSTCHVLLRNCSFEENAMVLVGRLLLDLLLVIGSSVSLSTVLYLINQFCSS